MYDNVSYIRACVIHALQTDPGIHTYIQMEPDHIYTYIHNYIHIHIYLDELSAQRGGKLVNNLVCCCSHSHVAELFFGAGFGSLCVSKP